MSRAEALWWLVLGRDRVVCGRVTTSKGAEPVELVSVPVPVTHGRDAPLALREALGSLGDALNRTPAFTQDTPRAVAVLVAEPWLGVATLPWSAQLKRRDTASAFAREQLLSAGVACAPSDEIRIDDARYGAKRAAVSYPELLRVSVSEFCARLGAELRSIAPLALVAAAEASRDATGHGSTLTIIEPGAATFVQCSGGAWTALASPVLLDGVTEVDGVLDSAWARLRLRIQGLPVALPQRVDVRLPAEAVGQTARGADRLFGTAVRLLSAAARRLASRTASADPLVWVASGRAAPHASAWQWALLALCAALAAGASLWAWQAAQVRSQLQSRLVSTGKQEPVPRSAARSREDEARVSAINVAVAQLNVPVGRLMDGLATPKDIQVALLSLELQADRATATAAAQPGTSLKLTADARTVEDMARYVSFLAQSPDLSSAYLVSHESDESASNGRLRFQVQATWRERPR